MSKHTESLKVWRCPRCGKQLLGATDGCVDGHPNTHAEEVEVIPVDSPQVLSPGDVKIVLPILRNRGFMPGSRVQKLHDRLSDWASKEETK